MKKITIPIKKILLNKYFTFLFLIILLQFKAMIFMGILNSPNAMSLNLNYSYGDFYKIIIHLLFPAFLATGIFLFKEKGRYIYLVIVDFFVSLLLLIDLMRYRVYENFVSLRQLFNTDLFNPMDKHIFDLKRIDIALFLDLIILIPIVILLILFYKDKEKKRSIKTFIVSFIICISLIFTSHYLVDIKDVTNGRLSLFNLSWYIKSTMDDLGPIGYHEYDIFKYSTATKKLSKDRKEEIKTWFENNKENLSDNKYKNMFEGKNLLIIQWESLENMVVGKSVNGKEITPTLNSLLKHSLYFENIFEQNRMGTTSDAELMVNTGLLPLRKEKYVLSYPWKKQNTLQIMLEKKGYTTISTHAEPGGNWNWIETHKAFGADKIWDVNEYKLDEVIGLGLSDRSFFNQVAEKLKFVKSPFYLFMTTLTSHGPFNIPEQYRDLNLPEKIDKSYLGGYLESVRYTDKQLGKFLKQIKENGQLENTLVVIYGDHGGLNKYYQADVKDLNFQGNWWLKDELKVPLFIFNPSIKGEVIKKNGGLVDVLPTISYLLGIDKYEFENTAIGRNLLNTNKDATLTSGGQVKGKVKNKNEQKHLDDMFSVNEDLIKSNYLQNNTKNKDNN
ncbi:LTA synthase family protein [Clostridium tarantellae]|uniref:Sulfatase-like hydrolase/transferase n=1 Tax=Clostridium tarantellae TaxID=39493 RepID=A0A6I1MJK3_9CLOT|nr:LTA synthase family protein [Clostridium tarantellae]MPQ42588.1 sulfatase-like hydrolase/transferase [Clostridium tarantellae]